MEILQKIRAQIFLYKQRLAPHKTLIISSFVAVLIILILLLIDVGGYLSSRQNSNNQSLGNQMSQNDDRSSDGGNPFTDSPQEVLDCFKEGLGQKAFEEISQDKKKPTAEERMVIETCSEKFDNVALNSGPKSWTPPSLNELENESANLKRMYPQTIKGLLDPGGMEFRKIIEEEVSKIKKMGVNTLYVYADHKYDNGTLKLSTTSRGGPTFADNAANDYIWQIVQAKKNGFAVMLSISFGGGENSKFGVSLDQFIKDTKDVALYWAEIAEKYQVEYFVPASEADWQIYREYYEPDWSQHQKAVDAFNKLHNDLLPEIRKKYKGKVAIQKALKTDKILVPGYDLVGLDNNPNGKSPSNFRQDLKEDFKDMETIAKNSNSRWFVAEFWVPYLELTGPNNPRIQKKDESGQLYENNQHEFYKIAAEEYQNFSGENKPVGFGFTSFLLEQASIKNRPAEDIIKDFYSQLR
ncbi:MAG: hypothetical protein Q8P83_00675 [bacterium]|nr:hypothetical protein [bacterium]